MYSTAFDVLMKLRKAYRPKNPTVATLQIFQRYSLSVIFMKFTKIGEAFLRCEELILVAFVEINVDASFDSI